MLIMLAMSLLIALLRIPLRSAGVAGVGLIMPMFLFVPMLIMAWNQRNARQRPRCPNCDLPLSYRPLGPNHGMLECPALCGYTRFVGDPGGRP